MKNVQTFIYTISVEFSCGTFLFSLNRNPKLYLMLVDITIGIYDLMTHLNLNDYFLTWSLSRGRWNLKRPYF